jgi:hypothetical protein
MNQLFSLFFLAKTMISHTNLLIPSIAQNRDKIEVNNNNSSELFSYEYYFASRFDKGMNLNDLSGTYGNYQTSYYEKRASGKKLRMRESQYTFFLLRAK